MMTMTHGGRVDVVGLMLLLLLGFTTALQAQPLLHHDFRVILQPETHQLQVVDTITLPATSQQTWQFRLHAGLHPLSPTPRVGLVREQNAVHNERPTVESYTVTLPPGERTFTIRYAGAIFHPLHQRGAAYARGFRETPGLIAPNGVYLHAATYWYPQFAGPLLTFSLAVHLPPTWEAVSQGKRTQHERHTDHTKVHWEASHPQEDIYLIAGPFTTYSQHTGAIQAMAFLRTPDGSLAQKYLETTGRYITMYRALIGPYPYTKFALVENFWETGYGMPSFTLLGSRVIRLPFILHSSYPHEILHNWWGNGVYVDATEGNWSEGLTAYLADHLSKEQRGVAAAYRRTILQRYTDYVTSGKDFPLTAFRARHDPITQAVGYGKTMMIFHMLRQHVGDQAFIHALQTFFSTYRFRRARFTELLQTFQKTAGIDLDDIYEQWIARTGAPALRLRGAQVRADGTTYVLTAMVEQVQPGPAYHLRLPLAVTMEGRDKAYHTTVEMRGARRPMELRLAARPLRLDLDPQFDLFRRLHRDEIPPALTQLFGAVNPMIVLPAMAPEAIRQAYVQLANTWQRPDTVSLEIRWDNDLTALPTDRAVWLYGWENRWRGQLTHAVGTYNVTIHPDAVQIGDTPLTRAAHTIVLTARHPKNPAHTLGWIATDNPSALPGLGRKLPHYGKYSYLGFTGDEPVNVAKGQWPVLHSPMTMLLPGAEGRVAQIARVQWSPSTPLAVLPAVFSAERMQTMINSLASDAKRGRGFGMPELDQVANFVAAQFRAVGLQPAGDTANTYFQTWRASGGDPEREAVLKNVVGLIPGRNPAWPRQSVVVGAHYDHLGLGWPDVHEEDVGKIHPGADDNASGVAVLIEVARVLAKDWQPERNVIFVAFSGEEAGRLGSQHYVIHTTGWPVAQTMGMINLDSVGRLGQNKLSVLGTASAREWPHIFRGVGFVTGVPVQSVADDWGASDQRSFLEAGTPAVQLFSGLHLDYHRPTDTADKIDPEGLVKIAAVTREAIVYLAGRAEPLTSQLNTTRNAPTPPTTTSPPRRRVSLGTIPDFTYEGHGYRISEIVPGLPAAASGLQPGDVIVRVETTPIRDIRVFANVLQALQPGETIAITFTRSGAEQTVQAQVVSR